MQLRLDSIDADLHRIDADVQSLKLDVAVLKATSATKADLAEAMGDLRAELHKEIAAQSTRYIGWLFVLLGLAVAAIKYLP